MMHSKHSKHSKRQLVCRTGLGLLGSALLAGGLAAQAKAPAADASGSLDTATIERLTGAKGSLDTAAGVFKVSVPRSDLAVQVGGVRMHPRLGLTSWAAFQRTGHGVMVMGDMVLLESQVNPVMSVALDNRLEVTALHNHFFGDEPRIMFMHIGGHGSVEDLATAVGQVFRAMKEKAPAIPRVEVDPAKTSLDAAKVEAALGAKGEMKDGVLRFTFGKTARMHGETVGAAMGVNTWAAFAGSDGQAAVDGDFAMEEQELQTVLKALRKGGIDVVAIHSHMTGEEPRIVFLHYWGLGPAARLAQALRSALAAQATAQTTTQAANSNSGKSHRSARSTPHRETPCSFTSSNFCVS
ncbi:MAG TPA: DUF1259 domain-containing protein [Thermoanaerobaculia bacterium]|nr:DUF1259 domain-containing protein [Thermoanaerobaculia bacterium]